MTNMTVYLYAERMMTLSRVYGFWKYVTNLERDETRRYLDMFYGLLLRKLSQGILHQRGNHPPADVKGTTPRASFG